VPLSRPRETAHARRRRASPARQRQPQSQHARQGGRGGCQGKAQLVLFEVSETDVEGEGVARWKGKSPIK
jgi:hypothetical protein